MKTNHHERGAKSTSNNSGEETAQHRRRQEGVVYQNRRFLWIFVFCTILCIHPLAKNSLSSFLVISVPTSNSARTVRQQSTKHNEEKENPFSFSDDDLHILEQNGCFAMKDICISSGVEQKHWFYRHLIADEDDNGKYQPDFILDLHQQQQQSTNLALAFSSEIMVKRNTHQHSKSCYTSPIANHIIVTGQFVDMVMEVYVRIVSGLWEIWNQFSETHWWKEKPHNPHVQLYVQVQGESGRVQLIPSMHPLLKGFSSNPLWNILDLFRQQKHNKNEDPANCHCYSRLAFCGYFDVNAQRRFYQKKRKKKGNQEMIPVDNANESLQILRIQPGLQVGRRKGEDVDPPIEWDKIRNHTRQSVFLAYPNLQQRITDFKKDLLIRALNTVPRATTLWIEEEVEQRLQQWTLVGFSQRSVRRRWLNLDDILQKCLQEWMMPYRIICVSIDLDSEIGKVPENQVIMHAGLDVLIGVHGSQQVHVVWMPDGAFVLELLPHLLGKWGQWTQTTERRTPNGKMINHTALNHVGYPLDASSVPDCQGSLSYLEECNNEKRWDNRDIWVHPDIIQSFIYTFLVLTPPGGIKTAAVDQAVREHTVTVTSSRERTCEYFDEVAYQEFVLYHVNCRDQQGKLQHQHYFRPRDSFEHLQRQRVEGTP